MLKNISDRNSKEYFIFDFRLLVEFITILMVIVTVTPPDEQ